MKTHRQYALFEKQEGKWIRLSSTAHCKEFAVRLFQNELLAPMLGYASRYGEVKGIRELRVVK